MTALTGRVLPHGPHAGPALVTGPETDAHDDEPVLAAFAPLLLAVAAEVAIVDGSGAIRTGTLAARDSAAAAPPSPWEEQDRPSLAGVLGVDPHDVDAWLTGLQRDGVGGPWPVVTARGTVEVTLAPVPGTDHYAVLVRALEPVDELVQGMRARILRLEQALTRVAEAVHVAGLPSARRDVPVTAIDGLNERERTTVLGLLNGATTEEIANALYVSPSTVRGYVSNAYKKLGVSSRRELVEYALRNAAERSERS